jgi:hypothetical protein
VGASSAIAVNFGIGFPRLEIGIFNSVVVPWIQSAYLIEGNYTSFPACRQIRAAFIGACGVDFSFFGLIDSKPKITLWDERVTLFQTGDCK